MDNLFCALGGSDHIGASCYYLQVDGHSFLLDCGIRTSGASKLPQLSLLTETYLEGIWQLDQVILSHAHMDHIGALPYLDSGREISVLCNPITQALTELQLREFDPLIMRFSSERQKRDYELRKDRVLSWIRPIGFGKPYHVDDYRITLFPAGHMPGAAMTYIETENHRILYSGDFSGQDQLLCGSYHLPPSLPVDLLIIEGTHAYAKDSWQLGYLSIERCVAQQLEKGNTVTLETTNVTKGIELARYLARTLKRYSCWFSGIYLDAGMAPIADAFERSGYQVYTSDIHPLLNRWEIGKQTIVIKKGRKGTSYGTVLNGDAFTLHADKQTLVDLINRIQAETTLIVHSQPDDEDSLANQLRIGEKACVQAGDGIPYLFV
ncbi:MBL fold metallo-hydrolase [Megasphaera sp.]|uniref:MBL fold metallo-hydrolase n=1 Tax=Megasphaera sp. TaxID=2023260 RepID=UPI00258B9FA9|nr:MBL fold metallo-hydrolase [Megasphaera sp.]